jgi:hypothetical protein
MIKLQQPQRFRPAKVILRLYQALTMLAPGAKAARSKRVSWACEGTLA